jgi:hypothetical protein
VAHNQNVVSAPELPTPNVPIESRNSHDWLSRVEQGAAEKEKQSTK